MFRLTCKAFIILFSSMNMIHFAQADSSQTTEIKLASQTSEEEKKSIFDTLKQAGQEIKAVVNKINPDNQPFIVIDDVRYYKTNVSNLQLLINSKEFLQILNQESDNYLNEDFDSFKKFDQSLDQIFFKNQERIMASETSSLANFKQQVEIKQVSGREINDNVLSVDYRITNLSNSPIIQLNFILQINGNKIKTLPFFLNLVKDLDKHNLKPKESLKITFKIPIEEHQTNFKIKVLPLELVYIDGHDYSVKYN